MSAPIAEKGGTLSCVLRWDLSVAMVIWKSTMKCWNGQWWHLGRGNEFPSDSEKHRGAVIDRCATSAFNAALDEKVIIRHKHPVDTLSLLTWLKSLDPGIFFYSVSNTAAWMGNRSYRSLIPMPLCCGLSPLSSMTGQVTQCSVLRPTSHHLPSMLSVTHQVIALLL